jgi:hypothetical protein
VAEHRAELVAQELVGGRERCCTPDLVLDLGLADHRRVQARGHPEQVRDGILATVGVPGRRQARGALAAAPGEPAAERVHRCGRRGQRVQLGAVARRQDDRRGDAGDGSQVGEQRAGGRLVQRDALAEVDRRGLVRDADRDERPDPGRGRAGHRLFRYSTMSACSRALSPSPKQAL